MTSVYVPYKDNLAAFVSVDSDATSDDYGKMRVLQLPNEQIARTRPGRQRVGQQRQRAARAAGASTVGETRPIYGNLLTLPVGDGLMYVQPVYAVRQLSDASYPILQFVIVSYGDQVGIGNTLDEALADVLGVGPGRPRSTRRPATTSRPARTSHRRRTQQRADRPPAAAGAGRVRAGRRGVPPRRPGRGRPADRAGARLHRGRGRHWPNGGRNPATAPGGSPLRPNPDFGPPRPIP